MDYPYIIAIFSVITKEGRYYIDIQDAMICVSNFYVIINFSHKKYFFVPQKLLHCVQFKKKTNILHIFFRTLLFFQLPPTFTFIQVVDIFIKLHHVFNFEYSKDFAKVLHFFEYTTYDIKSSERFLTPRIKEIMNIIFDEKDENHNNT